MAKRTPKVPDNYCDESNYERECPIMDIHDRLNESYYHILEMAQNYHNPTFFRFSLNAFLSSFQSMKYLICRLSKKDAKVDGIRKKYLENLDGKRLFIKRMIDSRNIVVHENNLKMHSIAKLGIFRWKSHKLSIEVPIDDIFIDSASILNFYKRDFVGQDAKIKFLDDEHSAIGEEFGVWRKWVVDDIGDKEILSMCLDAYDYFADIIADIHKFYGKTLVLSVIKKDYFLFSQVMVESDLDSSLHKKWGWD